MKISLYRSVFNNVYLSNKIFATVHQIQRYKHSLKYDDIVDIDWMYDNKHIGLLREKIKRNIQLKVDYHLFLKVADTHPDIFIQLFESDRYSLLVHASDFIGLVKNIEVFEYLVEKGYAAGKKMSTFDQKSQEIHSFQQIDPAELDEWNACIGKDEKEFMNTWNRLESRILFISGRMYYIKNTDQVGDNVMGIDEHMFYILSQVCKSLQLVHFLVYRGFNKICDIKAPVKYTICLSTLKCHYQDISQKDRDLIQSMAVNDFKFVCMVLTNCHLLGHKENFPFFFSLFTQGLNARKMKEMVRDLFARAAEDRDVFLYESLEGIGYQFSMFNNDSTYHYEFKSMLPHFGKMIDSFPQEQKDQGCCQMLVSLMDSNIYSGNTDNYFGFKYLFTKHKFSTLMDTAVIQAFADCNNLSFIDYLWMNRSTCFIETSSPADINTFFTTLFNHASTTPNMALLEYLIKNRCIYKTDYKNLTMEPYFGCSEPIDPKYNLDVLVHCIDNRFFDSVDPYVNYLLDPDSECSTPLVEYIYRNQDKFNTEISFQSIYDQIKTSGSKHLQNHLLELIEKV